MDFIADAQRLPLADASCDALLLFGVVEHFGIIEIQAAFLEIARVLVPGGRVRFDVPDFDWFVDVYRTGIDPVTNRPVDPVRDERWIMHAFFGGQDGPGQFHRWGWSERRMRDFLMKPNWGFSDVQLIGRQWRDPESNHLVFECVK